MAALQFDIAIDGGTASSADASVTATMQSYVGPVEPMVSGMLLGGM